MGTGSDGFKYALWLLDGRLKDLDARIVHVLHDEIIIEVSEDIAGQAEEVVKDCMEKVFGQLKIGVSMHVEPDIKDTWG